MNQMARDVTLLFLAVSAADREIIKEEVFLMEKCALDYGIKEEDWCKGLNESFVTYFNQGDAAVSAAILRLSKSLDKDQKKEFIEDLLAIALADDIFHENEKKIIKRVCKVFDVHFKVPVEFGINCV